MNENCPKCGKFLNEGELCECDAVKDSSPEASYEPEYVSETKKTVEIQQAIEEPAQILKPEVNSILEEFKNPDKTSTEKPTSKCFNDKDSQDKNTFYHSEPLDESFNPPTFEPFTGEPIEILEIKTDSNSQEKKYNTFISNIINIIKLFFKKPYSTTILAAKYNPLMILFMVCIQAAAAGLFSIILVNRLVDESSKWLPSIDRILGLGGLLRYWDQSINIPYFEIFFKIFAIVIIQFFILAGLFYVCGKLFGQKEGSFQAVVSVLGIASVISSAIILAATLLMPMLPLIINFMLILAFVATLLLNHAGIREVFSIEENKGVYLTPLIYILYFILISLFIIESLNASLRYLF